MHTNEALRRLRFDPFKPSEPVLACINGEWFEGVLGPWGIQDYGSFIGAYFTTGSFMADGSEKWTLVAVRNLRRDSTRV